MMKKLLILTGVAEAATGVALSLGAGKIVEAGPPSQVLKQPTNPRTRQFLRAILER